MAVSSEESDSEFNEIDDTCEPFLGVRGYQFEPTKTRRTEDQAMALPEDTEERRPVRIGNTDFPKSLSLFLSPPFPLFLPPYL